MSKLSGVSSVAAWPDGVASVLSASSHCASAPAASRLDVTAVEQRCSTSSVCGVTGTLRVTLAPWRPMPACTSMLSEVRLRGPRTVSPAAPRGVPADGAVAR